MHACWRDVPHGRAQHTLDRHTDREGRDSHGDRGEYRPDDLHCAADTYMRQSHQDNSASAHERLHRTYHTSTEARQAWCDHVAESIVARRDAEIADGE